VQKTAQAAVAAGTTEAVLDVAASSGVQAMRIRDFVDVTTTDDGVVLFLNNSVVALIITMLIIGFSVSWLCTWSKGSSTAVAGDPRVTATEPTTTVKMTRKLPDEEEKSRYVETLVAYFTLEQLKDLFRLRNVQMGDARTKSALAMKFVNEEGAPTYRQVKYAIDLARSAGGHVTPSNLVTKLTTSKFIKERLEYLKHQ
jgi:hypothetical protein